jgi:predicted metal-binding membrane protein
MDLLRTRSASGSPGAMRLGEQRALFIGFAASLVLAAWLTLWLWSSSPYQRYLDHGTWSDASGLAELCRAIPAGEVLVPALLYATGWVVMIAAMMLPTIFPLLDVFRRMTAARADAATLLALVASGYLLAWFGFGLLAHALDIAVHTVVERTSSLALNSWLVGAVVVGGAGAFQFSAIKYRCLDRCRTPLGFVVARWRGLSPAREALRIGLHHGLFCVGCCWAIMLLMFVVGSGNLGWMLVLAAIMAAEKNLPGGQRLSAPLGLALLAWAAGIVAANM